MSTLALNPEEQVTPPKRHDIGIGTGRAFALALLTETLILIAVVTLLAHSEHPVKRYTPVTPLTIVNEPTPPKPVEKPKPPEPKPVVHKVVIPKPVVVPTPPKPQPVPTPLPKTEAPTPFTTPTPPPPPPPPEPQPDLSAQQKAMADYASKIHAAVQAAVYYPPAAVAMHFSGRALVAFHLMNTTVSGIKIVTTSGLGLVDNAAIQAVQNAQYPEPPANLRDKDQTFRVWVELSLNHNN